MLTALSSPNSSEVMVGNVFGEAAAARERVPVSLGAVVGLGMSACSASAPVVFFAVCFVRAMALWLWILRWAGGLYSGP